MVVLNNVKNMNNATIIIHGVSDKYQAQMERLVKKGIKSGLSALNTGVVPGYGIIYPMMAKRIREESTLMGSKEAIAMEKVADVLEGMYKTLAENAGNHPIDALAAAKKMLSDCSITIKNVVPAGVLLSELERAKEAIVGMLRIDEVLSVKPLYKTEGFGGSGVVIYTSEGCPWCARTKEYLRSKGVSFKEINVSRNPAAIQDMIRVSGQTGTPVTVINGQAVVGFDVEKLNALL